MSFPPIPPSGSVALDSYLRAFSNEVDRRLREKMSSMTGVDSVLLVSPSRKVYSVQVADDGTLVVNLVTS